MCDSSFDVEIGAGRVARMRKRAAGRDVDGVDARLDQPLAHLRRLLDRVARAFELEDEQRVVVLGGADLHLQVEVATDPRADGPDDLEDEARAVLERSAVFVRAIVDGRAQELRDQVAVGAVQLDAVEAGLARAPGALGKRGHDLA